MTFPWRKLSIGQHSHYTHCTPSGPRDDIPTLTYSLKEAPRRSAEVRAADSITL
jgi:hypothetical protein